MVQTKNLILFCSLLTLCVLSAIVDATTKPPILPSKPLPSTKKWPMTNQKPYKVIIPIEIREADYTEEALANYKGGLKDIENKTCVQFVDRLSNITRYKDYIYVYDAGDNKCSSPVGKQGGRQDLQFTNACMLVRKKCVHELLHAMGFDHMHQRFDRDNAITILWDNIGKVNKQWFYKYDNAWQAFNTPYDVFSCMHYADDGFSENGNLTIKTKNPKYQDAIGTQYTLSEGDAQRIVRMYKCPGQYWTKLGLN